MTDELLSEEDVVELIEAEAQKLGSRKALAEASGAAPGHLAGMVAGHKILTVLERPDYGH